MEEVRRFVEDCLLAVGAPLEAAKAQAALLVHADTVGHYSHGINRLGEFLGKCLPVFFQFQNCPVLLKKCCFICIIFIESLITGARNRLSSRRLWSTKN